MKLVRRCGGAGRVCEALGVLKELQSLSYFPATRGLQNVVGPADLVQTFVSEFTTEFEKHAKKWLQFPLILTALGDKQSAVSSAVARVLWWRLAPLLQLPLPQEPQETPLISGLFPKAVKDADRSIAPAPGGQRPASRCRLWSAQHAQARACSSLFR